MLRHFGYIWSASPTDAGRGPPRLELSVGRGPPRLILIFDSDSDSNKNTHWCIHVFSLASICYMYTMLAAAAV